MKSIFDSLQVSLVNPLKLSTSSPLKHSIFRLPVVALVGLAMLPAHAAEFELNDPREYSFAEEFNERGGGAGSPINIRRFSGTSESFGLFGVNTPGTTLVLDGGIAVIEVSGDASSATTVRSVGELDALPGWLRSSATGTNSRAVGLQQSGSASASLSQVNASALGEGAVAIGLEQSGSSLATGFGSIRADANTGDGDLYGNSAAFGARLSDSSSLIMDSASFAAQAEGPGSFAVGLDLMGSSSVRLDQVRVQSRAQGEAYGVRLRDSSQAEIFGGSIDALAIRGSEFAVDVSVEDLAVLTLFGRGFNYDYGEVTDLSGEIGGFLQNTTRYEIVTFQRLGGGRIILAPPVPVPAAAWLFGSALLGLVGTARRRYSLKIIRKEKPYEDV